MAAAPIPISSQKETFYVPDFAIFIQDEVLGPRIMNDILQVTYKDSLNEIDSFNIEINNWDADKRNFKFAPPQKEFEGIFDPGKKIEIRMGYYKNMRRMMRGVITGLEPNYPESGASTLSVHGLNELHQYRTEQHTFSWTENKKTDTEIAEELCKSPIRKGLPGLGLEIDPHPAQNEKHQDFVFMNNQFDIVFLLELARRNGYEIYLKDEAKTPTLFFGISDLSGSVPVYQFEWGKSLISFRPTLTTANQVGDVVVRGWDRKANKPIEEHYALKDLWKDEKLSKSEIARQEQIAKAYGNRIEVITDEPIHTTKEAQSRAKAIMSDKHHKMVEAKCATVGLPDLRSGCSVEILGFGVKTNSQGVVPPGAASSDFDGEYIVLDSTHTIGGSGYRTEFSARRKGDVTQRKPKS